MNNSSEIFFNLFKKFLEENQHFKGDSMFHEEEAKFDSRLCLLEKNVINI